MWYGGRVSAPAPLWLTEADVTGLLGLADAIAALEDGLGLEARGEAVNMNKTHVRWDWTVFADRPLLHYLTPVLRPLFRWNHSWAVARAREGLEPYARSRAVAPKPR